MRLLPKGLCLSFGPTTVPIGLKDLNFFRSLG
jgi:hypothetical protein